MSSKKLEPARKGSQVVNFDLTQVLSSLDEKIGKQNLGMSLERKQTAFFQSTSF